MREKQISQHNNGINNEENAATVSVKNMNIIYGHRHLNWFFKELFEMTDKGIKYKGKEYSWDNIQKIKRAPGSYSVNLCYPGAIIYLDDGRKIWINGRVFTRAGEKPKFKTWSFISGESQAFLDFLELIEQKREKNT